MIFARFVSSRFFIVCISLSMFHCCFSSLSHVKASHPKHYVIYKEPLQGSLLDAYNGNLSDAVVRFRECFNVQLAEAFKSGSRDVAKSVFSEESFKDDVCHYLMRVHPESGDTPAHLGKGLQDYEVILKYAPELMAYKNEKNNNVLHCLAYRANVICPTNEKNLGSVKALEYILRWYSQSKMHVLLNVLLLQKNNRDLTPLDVAKKIRSDSVIAQILDKVTPKAVSLSSSGIENRVALVMSQADFAKKNELVTVLGTQKKNITPPVSPEKIKKSEQPACASENSFYFEQGSQEEQNQRLRELLVCFDQQKNN